MRRLRRLLIAVWFVFQRDISLGFVRGYSLHISLFLLVVIKRIFLSCHSLCGLLALSLGPRFSSVLRPPSAPCCSAKVHSSSSALSQSSTRRVHFRRAARGGGIMTRRSKRAAEAGRKVRLGLCSPHKPNTSTLRGNESGRVLPCRHGVPPHRESDCRPQQKENDEPAFSAVLRRTCRRARR